MTKNLPSGTVTFLFTDIEGSTRLSQEHPDAMQVTLTRHHAILNAAIEANNGYVFQIVGDSFAVAFHNALDALQAALAAQRGLRDEAWPATGPIRVRMGLHTGAVQLNEDRTTVPYLGYATLASVQRIMSAGHGMQILLSHVTYSLLRDALPANVTLRDLGEHRLKDLLHSVHLYQVTTPDLPADFPQLKTLNAFPNNLPLQLTSFIGRERELDEVKQLLSSARLLTLIGPGGTGKTRLSLQLAANVLTLFHDGIWLVELAPLADPALIEQTVAYALGLREPPGQSLIELIAEYLQSRNTLLILDNCEHLVEATAKLADHLLRVCPHLKIIASSREALSIAGETIYRVPSLSLPQSDAATSTLMQYEAIQLFVQRARTGQPGFDMTSKNASAIANICLRLDGIPLAIELAAARTKMLSAEQIAARLDDRFRLLTGGSRTALPRQQTLRALIDWSYSLLTEPEQTLFRRLSVFTGGWTLEAAEQICVDRNNEHEILDLLTRLVDKSLVITEETTNRGGYRYRYLETIRQYAREKLLESDEIEKIRDKHLGFYAEFAEGVGEGLYTSERFIETRQLQDEHDNLRAALEWGLAKDPDTALRMAGALQHFWAPGGYAVEGHRWTQQALARTDDLPNPTGDTARRRVAARARALIGLAYMSISQGDNQSGVSHAEAGIKIYRQLEDQHGLAFALQILALAWEILGNGVQAEALLRESIVRAHAENNASMEAESMLKLGRVIATTHGDVESARRQMEQALQLSRDAKLPWLNNEAEHMATLGHLAAYQNDYAGAHAHFERAISAYQELGARFNVIMVKSDLAHLERNHGHLSRALEIYRETIVAFEALGQRGAVAHQLECLAFIAGAQERFEQSARLLAAAEILREHARTPMTPDERIIYDQQVAVVRERMDEPAFASAWREGRTMTMKQAIDYALQIDSGMHA